MFFLFTPTAMTRAKLDEYKRDADGIAAKGKMQVFKPKDWAAGSTTQAHSLTPALIEPAHARMVALQAMCRRSISSPLGKAMKRQLFPAIDSAYAGLPPPSPDQPSPGRLGVLLDKLKRTKGAAVVTYDHIGIAQELNDFRNAALEPIDAFPGKRRQAQGQQSTQARNIASHRRCAPRLRGIAHHQQRQLHQPAQTTKRSVFRQSTQASRTSAPTRQSWPMQMLSRPM